MGLIPDEIIAQIIDRNNIVDTISSYVPLKKAGRNFKACCPFHNEKTPSFVVNPDKQIFHCFGCHVGGNVISFVMMQEKTEFPMAARLLAQKAGISFPEDKEPRDDQSHLRQKIFTVNELAVRYFHENLLSEKSNDAKKARKYLKERGVSLDTAKKFQLGLAPDQWDGLLNYLKGEKVAFALMEKAGLIIARENKEGYYDRFRNRIIFPIFDTQANCRAFGARALQESTAKYINSPETFVYTKGHHLFGFHLAKKKISDLDYVIVTEGYMDSIMPHQAGVENVVASLGTALTVEQIRLLRRYTKNVVMLFDMDLAGESAMIRSFDLLVDEGMNVRVASLTEGEDPDSFVRKKGVEEFQKRIADAKTLFDYKLLYLTNKYDARTVEGKAKISGEMLPTIDKFSNAVIRGEYIRALSQRLMISETALVTEIKKISTGQLKSYDKKPVREESFINKQTRTVEKDILRLLLREDAYVEKTRDHVDLSDFQDHDVRSVMSKIFEMFEKNQKVDVGNLINSFEDKSLQEMVSRLAAEENAADGDKNKMHEDYIRRMKKDKATKRRQEILVAMTEAQSQGDQEELQKLMKEFNQIVKK